MSLFFTKQKRWDDRYLKLAEFWACQCSKDPSTKVGAVIVNKKNRVASLGYNGLPCNVADTPERLNNRELKYKLIVHGEINAIASYDGDMDGYTLYTWPFMPCSRCAGVVIQKGISRVVAPVSDNPRWQEDFALTRAMFAEAGVELVEVGKEEDYMSDLNAVLSSSNSGNLALTFDTIKISREIAKKNDPKLDLAASDPELAKLLGNEVEKKPRVDEFGIPLDD